MIDNIFTNPLSTSLLIYITISVILLVIKPEFVFGIIDDENLSNIEQRNRILLVFVLLAIFIYSIVSAYISKTTRDSLCSDLMNKNFKNLLETMKCDNTNQKL
jgi:hypothetical protein